MFSMICHLRICHIGDRVCIVAHPAMRWTDAVQQSDSFAPTFLPQSGSCPLSLLLTSIVMVAEGDLLTPTALFYPPFHSLYNCDWPALQTTQKPSQSKQLPDSSIYYRWFPLFPSVAPSIISYILVVLWDEKGCISLRSWLQMEMEDYLMCSSKGWKDTGPEQSIK